MFIKKKLLTIIVISLVVVAILLYYLNYSMQNFMRNGEITHHDTKATFNAVCTYLENNNGQWPKSWVDLKPYLTNVVYFDIDKYVIVNFDVDLQDMCSHTYEDFNAITPNPKTKVWAYDYKADAMALLDVVRKYHLHQTQPVPVVPPPPRTPSITYPSLPDNHTPSPVPKSPPPPDPSPSNPTGK